MKPFILSAAIVAGYVVQNSPALSDTGSTDALGTWQTPIGEQPVPDGPSAFVRATTIFTETAQDLIFEAFADPEGTIPLMTYRSSGPWKDMGTSQDVPGAMAVNMTNDYSRVEIFVDAPEIWAAINLSSCPLEIGVEVDITDCVSGPPFIVTDCVDLDIVMVDEDGQRLRFGGGDVDRCVTRPTTLSEIAYMRVE